MSNPFSDPPPPPPKQVAPSRRQQQQPLQTTKSNTRTESSQAHHHSRSTDPPPPRTRPSRSQTTGLSAPSNAISRPQPTPARRSHSSDSVPSDKAKLHRSKTKKSSIHADVIDRLDFTGVGPMFHHDGPFDACAPSRNRHRTKAPMYAWTSINAEDEEVAARYRDKEDALNPITPTLTYNASYPSSEPPRSPPVTANYTTYYSEPPKKKVDAIAEAWGIHEPEPYEEFFAGGGDPDGPITNGNSATKETRSNGRRTRDDLTSRPRGSNRSNIPPPQPIFVGDGPDSPQPSPSVGGANLGRNKSLIQRIRKMRDSPNVPVGFDEMGAPTDGAPSPTSSAETKDLPATPASPGVDGYFDSPGGGLGRKTSILKRVKGVVRGGR
ncbi:Pal1 cell morphology protein-domain-containing protein [Multifurca ochricompacta]|uniref:Pal1 cell morphology protein-domain-containing protein n=1 Tax=Multifurca ochricompacta TaxID=376703 RepID=A0AAD4QRT1_9AGAM|nr:Pal1 cell morphology protein-domain-containing protein [Multifurca ochricompacta]